MRHLALLIAIGLALASCDTAKETPKGKTADGKAAPTTKAPAQAATAAKPAPPLQIAAWFNSEPLTLEGLKGKVVVLDFWNTTCGPCRKLMPHLEELYNKHKADGLVVIGVTEDAKADLEAFLKDNKVAYPIAADVVDGTGKTFDAYGIGGIPTVYLIARDGSVAWHGPGGDLTDAMVEAELAKK